MFFPVSPDLPGKTFTAKTFNQNAMEPVIVGSITSMVPIFPSVIVMSGNIACKGEGRPKADITWSAVDSSGAAVAINTSNIIVPREGRSILRVEFNEIDTAHITYTCTASNNAGTVMGRVTVQPRCK